MAKGVPNNRVREARLAAGLTMEQLAEKASAFTEKPVHFTTIHKIESSVRKASDKMLVAIAQALGVDPADLFESAPKTIPVRLVPIIGSIPAGNWKEAIADPQGFISVPTGGPNAFALKPTGTSMNLVVGEEAYIVVDPDQPELVEGKLYAIMNGDGETTFKRFRSAPPTFEPVSSDPEHQPIPIGREPFTVLGRVIWQGSLL